MKNSNRAEKLILVGSVLSALTFLSGSAFAEGSSACSDGREVFQKDGETFYLVRNRAPTLYMISRDLYGDESYWQKIATWNKIPAPFTLKRGQLLSIQTPPRLNEVEGTKTLIAAWTKLIERQKGNPETSERIRSLEACLPKAEPEVFTAAEPEKPIVPQVAPVVETPVVAPAPAPVPEKVVVSGAQTDLDEVPEDKPGSRLAFSAALTSSLIRLESKDASRSVHNILYSKPSYGVEAMLGRQWEKWGYAVSAGIEHMQMEPAKGAVIANDAFNLLNASMTVSYQVARPFGLSLRSAYVQRPFSRPTLFGTEMDTVFIPEFSLGARVRLFEAKKNQFWFLAEGTYTSPKKDDHQDVKSGYGYSAGFRIEHQLEGSSVYVSPMYRFLNEDTQTAVNKQRAFLLQLGWSL